ncbi:MAG: polysaccharide deacetylase family protein [Desulfobacteraceae bacterium]
MKHAPPHHFPYLPKGTVPAKAFGIGAIGLSLVAALIHPLLAALPLLLFLILCFTAPLLPGFSFFLPIISRGPSEKQAVALTFDDGPNPLSTPGLLALLSEYRVIATFFVNGHRAEQFPVLIRQIISQGHTIGNHTYSHDNLIMFKSTQKLKTEIEKTQQVLHDLDVFPLTFRPPVGVTNPRLKPVLEQLGLYTVNFSRRAGDRGNRRIHDLSNRILGRLRSGDVIMLHDIPPRNGGTQEAWLKEVERLIAGIQRKKLQIIPLAELIGRPVMAELQKPEDSRSGVAEGLQ